jgi:hypothetical protein
MHSCDCCGDTAGRLAVGQGLLALKALGPEWQLSQQGKLVLAKDLGEVQLVVGQGLFPLEALGPAHRYVLCCELL